MESNAWALAGSLGAVAQLYDWKGVVRKVRAAVLAGGWPFISHEDEDRARAILQKLDLASAGCQSSCVPNKRLGELIAGVA